MGLAPLIVIGIVLYALFAVFTSKAGGHIDASASSLIFNGMGAIVPLFVLVIARFARHTHVIATRDGYIYSVLAGLAVASFSILLIRIYARGGSLPVVFPVIYGGAIALAAVIGWITVRGSFSPAHALGVGLIVAGIGVVAFL